MQNNPHELLERAWQKRQEQDHNSCRLLLAQLKSSLGMELGSLSIDQIHELLKNKEKRLEDRLLTETLTLTASMARADRQFSYSAEILKTLKEASLSGKIPSSFRLFQELGHQSFLTGDFSSALEFYYGSKTLATDETSFYLAVINILLSLEIMELPREQEEQEVQKALLSFKKQNQSIHQEIFGVYELYLARKEFQRGKPSLSLKKLACLDQTRLASYQRSFILSLSFHKFYNPKPIFQAEALEKGRSLFLGSYRMRTLIGLIHLTDKDVPRLGEVIERTYLWMWKWFTEPHSFTLSKLILQLRQILDNNSQALCEEDISRLSIIFTWLELFSPESSAWFRELNSRFNLRCPPQGSIFEYEYLTAKYLLLERDGQKTESQDLLQYLKESSFWTNNELYFSSFINSVLTKKKPPEQIKFFCKEINLLIGSPKVFKKGLLVDMRSFQIYDEFSDKPLPSNPMSLALMALKKSSTLTFREFLYQSFQYIHYDPIIHDPKLYNLIARIKRILPSGLRIKTKEGRIHTSGNWDLVKIHTGCYYTRLLLEEPLWIQLIHAKESQNFHPEISATGKRDNIFNKNENSLETTSNENNKAHSPKKLFLHQLEKGKVFTRSFLEKEYSLKRSTANRIIAQLEKENQITKIGSGKNTKYTAKVRLSILSKKNFIVKENF